LNTLYKELEEMMMRDRQKKNKVYSLRYFIFDNFAIFLSFKQEVKTTEYFLIPNYILTKFVFVRE
jgi:hypothetical protein